MFTIIYHLLNKFNYDNYLLSFYISIPVYICLINLSKTIHFYSVLIIGIDLFFFNQLLNKNKQKNKHKNKYKKTITKHFTELANNYFDYLKKNKNNKTENKKLIKNYIKTKFNITDTLQHTINNIN